MIAVVVDTGVLISAIGWRGPAHRCLALVARHLVYGENIVSCGPTYDSFKVEGQKIRVAFKNIGSGLCLGSPPADAPGNSAAPLTALTGFEIAGADMKWFPAEAVINGASVLISSAQVAAPVAVRYAWADNPSCNLYNKEGLPAAPFRTSDLK